MYVYVCSGSQENQRVVPVPSTLGGLSRDQYKLDYSIMHHHSANHNQSEQETVCVCV